MLASMEAMAENGRTRLPNLVLTISEAMRVRSSCGARVTSRTRPVGAPDRSKTVAPRSSERGSVVIPVENSRVLRRKGRQKRKPSGYGAEGQARHQSAVRIIQTCGFFLI